MDCKFTVGQKIVCINDEVGAFPVPGKNHFGDLEGLTKGNIYTISSIEICDWSKRLVLVLAEVKRKPFPGALYSPGFDYRRFKPLEEKKQEKKQKTDISIFQNMLKKNYTIDEVEELMKDYDHA